MANGHGSGSSQDLHKQGSDHHVAVDVLVVHVDETVWSAIYRDEPRLGILGNVGHSVEVDGTTPVHVFHQENIGSTANLHGTVLEIVREALDCRSRINLATPRHGVDIFNLGYQSGGRHATIQWLIDLLHRDSVDINACGLYSRHCHSFL